MLSMKRFRFMAMAILAALAVSLAAALPGVSADGGDDKAAPIPRSGETTGDNQAPPIPEKAELNYPNLGSHLDQLVASVEAGQATAQGAASNSPHRPSLQLTMKCLNGLRFDSQSGWMNLNKELS